MRKQMLDDANRFCQLTDQAYQAHQAHVYTEIE